jgi:hypothetical protein
MSLWVALASANLRRDLAAVRAFQKHTTEPDEVAIRRRIDEA